MRRTDRLFALIEMLHDGRAHTAAALAGRLAVSTRTIWRDMETLAASGVPVSGTRGSGYRLARQMTLPPLSLAETELEALHLGLALVAETADPELQGAARALTARIEDALPGRRDLPATAWGEAAFPFAEAAKGFTHMPLIRAAIRDRRRLRLRYDAPERSAAERIVRPLQMAYQGRLWSLTAWCEMQDDFRLFRVDRIAALEDSGETFEDEPGKRLEDYVERFAAGPDGN